MDNNIYDVERVAIIKIALAKTPQTQGTSLYGALHQIARRMK